MTGNAITLASAVALSQSLGLNRDPTHWDIPDADKALRIRIWWCVVCHDRWCSLAHGTPPLIHDNQHDVPIPTLEQLVRPHDLATNIFAAEVFQTLCSLTRLLAQCLSSIYHIPAVSPADNIDSGTKLRRLELRLAQWEDALSDMMKEIVIRHQHTEVPGASNIRLSYLSVRLLLLRRIDIDTDNSQPDLDIELIVHKRLRAQKAAEDISHFVQNLHPTQLADFWHPSGAFLLASTATLLLRCAVEGNATTTSDLSNNTALRRAEEFLSTLRDFKENHGWDLGDICLAQCGEVMESLKSFTGNDPGAHLEQLVVEGIPLVDELFQTPWELFDTY
ncbi:putative fungal specific transcription factor domain-containing protein [Phaeomoniella chlamydospora]|uniref:Putative fungal specific transcription factor domain-containing protein n=1 Tax=Phaeomoniella chlamydospora TaxID=158046 RepID=A0A0G2E5R6_PHACM|nr:putative fungal specific transcription factor domain-containing protein [Phaeomoniella chlamydospora]